MTRARMVNIPVLITALIALVMGALVIGHVKWVNGPWYWFWPWRRESLMSSYGAMLLAAAPLILAHAIYLKWRVREGYLVPLLMLTSYAMMLANIVAPPGSSKFRLLRDAVRSPYSMSYYLDAQALRNVPDWLPQYDAVMPHLNMHTQTKPPGPVLFFMLFMNIYGPTQSAAIAGGLAIGVIATFSILFTFALVKLLSGRGDAALYAASLLALCPSLVVVFPLFDPCYMIFSCALVGLWALALSRNRFRYAIAMGVVAGLMVMVTFTVTTLGLFLAAYALLCTGRSIGKALNRAVIQGAVALGAMVVTLALLWLISGYNFPKVFQSAWTNQLHLTVEAHQPRLPITIPWNLEDFLLGCGWIGFPLAICGAWRAQRTLGVHDRLTRTMWLSIAIPLVLALLGLFPTETLRVWNFLLPLVMLPAGYEVTHWRPRERWIALGAMWLATATVSQNMWIVLPWAGWG